MQAIRRLRDWAARNVAVITVSMAVLIGVTSWYQLDQIHENAHRDRRVAECQARFNDAFTQTLKLRADASNARQDAVDSLLVGTSSLILNPPANEKERAANSKKFRELFQVYVEAVKKNNETRENNPLPELPNCELIGEEAS